MERRPRTLVNGIVLAALVAANTSVRATMITLPTNTSPRVRDIGAHYFDSLNQSQVWVNPRTRTA
jgi:spore coat protein CotF